MSVLKSYSTHGVSVQSSQSDNPSFLQPSCDVYCREGESMFIVMNRIPVAEGREQDFERSFMNRDRAVNQMPGFIDMQVLRPAEGRTYVVLTRWQTREAFQNW